MGVKKLKEISVSAIYKDIVSTLFLASINNSTSEEPLISKKVDKTGEVVESQSGNWSVKSNGESTAKKKKKFVIQAVVDGVKKRLDEYLVGSYRHIREDLWEEYINGPAYGNRPDLLHFLGCILDDNFIKLE